MRGLGVVIGQLISGPWSLLKRKRKRKIRWLLKVIFLYTLTHSSNEEWSHCWSLDHYGKDLSYLRHYLKLHHLSFDEKQLLELLQIVVDAVEVIALAFLNLLFQYHQASLSWRGVSSTFGPRWRRFAMNYEAMGYET